MADLQLELLRLAGQGRNCSQIVLQLGLELCGEDDPGLLRMVHGLGHGLGHSGEVCGAVLGGICLLSWHAGKGSATEEAHPQLDVMAAELVDWFRTDACAGFGGIRCGDILDDQQGVPHLERCSRLASDVYEKSLALLEVYGVDPTQMPPHQQLGQGGGVHA